MTHGRVNSERHTPPSGEPRRPWHTLLTLPLFMALAWAWAAWWMGDIFRVAREQSFFAADATLMHFLLQQHLGWLWTAGRALLTLYRWPALGGFVVALMLTATTWSMSTLLAAKPQGKASSPTSYILHLTSLLPACAWMTWTAWTGLNLFYQAEPGRTPALLIAITLITSAAAIAAKALRRSPAALAGSSASVAYVAVSQRPTPARLQRLAPWLATATATILCFAIPAATTHLRHPYARPLTRMQVQMLASDWEGMAATARDNATLSYRPIAAYYAIALIHTGHLTDALFDIRLDYDSLRITDYGGKPTLATTYYLADCNYNAGLFRTATHNAMEHLTMNGPTLHALKHLTRLALLDNAWPLARKYLHIIGKTPFESDFVERYSAMVGSEEAVAADPDFALLRRTEPVADSFESQHQEPTFLGYTATLLAGRTQEALMQSIMANLYSKRMPDFIMRTQPLVGSTPPRTIAEGLVTQSPKNPDILRAFPQLQMDAQRYRGFVQSVQTELKDRPAHARRLFDTYRGYYPYYYFFGNLKATRKPDSTQHASSSAGVN